MNSNINKYIKQETGLDLKAEKLKTRYDTYSSFYIRCSGRVRDTLIDGRLWPIGALVKPYFS